MKTCCHGNCNQGRRNCPLRTVQTIYIVRIATRRPFLSRLVESRPFIVALYTGGIVWLILANLENFT